MMLGLQTTPAPPVDLDGVDLLLVALCVVVNALLSIRYRLSMERPLAIASLRTVVQLLGIGLVLKQVFAIDSFVLVIALLCLMTLAASFAMIGRVRYRFRGMLAVALGSIALPAFLMTAYAVFLVIQPPEWGDPRYWIPLMGMVLGNSLTAVSIGMDRFVSSVVERRREIEAWMCLGADTHEAVHDFTRSSIRAGMMPMLNAMTVVGIVSLPGMMTGQILGGVPPMLAVRYQILIMFLLAGGTALGSGIGVLWLRRILFDARGRLQRDIRAKGA